MYRGLPPARSVEQAIVVAQQLIARDLEQRAMLQAQVGEAAVGGAKQPQEL
jgi:hypothetical protein